MVSKKHKQQIEGDGERERFSSLFQDERNSSINVTNVSDPVKKEKLVAPWGGVVAMPLSS